MDNHTNNKRIAKNTLLIYFRMLFMMAVSLFTSRITLETLGITDYGIYNVIGGMVAMFSILSGSLSIAIGRFITVEMGSGDREKLATIFSTSVSIQLFMAVVVCVFAEVAGGWFLNNKMVIPADRLDAAHWVLHLSIMTFMVNLVSVPYNAVIIAHEKMSAFAYISILEALLKLVIVYFLYVSPFDKLVIYSILLACVAVLIRLVYGTYCRKHFAEARYKLRLDKKQLRNMLVFIGWAFWGNGVVVLKDQGTNVLLNMFCGPAVNAARGVAMQVNTAVYNFVQNFMIAVNPQITKSYSVGDLSSMHKLVIRSAKFGYFILLVMLMPVCANINYVLDLWLVEVPEHTANFIILILLYSSIDCMVTPLCTGVIAEGNIKPYEIAVTLFYSTNIILSYFCLKNGMVAESVFVLNIIFKACILGALLVQSRYKYAFPVRCFFKQCILPCLLIFGISVLFTHFIAADPAESFGVFVQQTLSIIFFVLVMEFAIGMSVWERHFVLKTINEKFLRKLSRK